jgi:hypothetical protein
LTTRQRRGKHLQPGSLLNEKPGSNLSGNQHDGRIADADPGILAVNGNITTRFEDRTLLDQATNRLPCELQFRWSAGPGQSLVWTAHRVFLPRGDRTIQGPGGVQTQQAFQAALDPVLNRAATCVLTNDVAAY